MSIVEDPLLWIDGCVKITATGIAAIVEIFEASWIYAITTSKGFHLHQPMTLYPPPITYHLSPINASTSTSTSTNTTTSLSSLSDPNHTYCRLLSVLTHQQRSDRRERILESLMGRRRIFKKAGYDKVLLAVGDHEIGE